MAPTVSVNVNRTKTTTVCRIRCASSRPYSLVEKSICPSHYKPGEDNNAHEIPNPSMQFNQKKKIFFNTLYISFLYTAAVTTSGNNPRRSRPIVQMKHIVCANNECLNDWTVPRIFAIIKYDKKKKNTRRFA